MPASGSNPPQRKGWREASKPGRAAGSSPASGKARGAGWTKKTVDDRYESALLRYRLRVASWSLLFCGLVGALVYWLLVRPVRTPLIAYAATGYAAPLPPHAWANEDLAGLRSLGSEGGLLKEKRIVEYCEMPAWETKDKWLRALRGQIEKSGPGGPNKNAIIIYLSVHGVLDESGEPCLIPPGASPWQSSQWVRVGELLNELFLYQDEKGRYATKIRDWNKLLVLDCNRIDANWNAGQFYNSFAARLRDVVQKANVPKLYVLNSASPGQSAWAAPELHGSVFGYFLAQGLGGAADAESAGNHNKQVSLRELHGYLKSNVDQWVIENRDDRQEPMLLPEDAPDVPLVHCAAESTVLPKDALKRDDRWDQVAALWQRHAQLRAKTPYRTKPMEWAAFQGDLLRAEQLLEAGSAYDREFNETIARLTSEAAALDRAAPATAATPYSVALAEQWRPASDKELQELPAPWLPGAKPQASDPAAAKPAAVEKADSKPPAAAAKDATKDAPAKDPAKPAPANAAPAAAASPPAPAPAERPKYAYLPAAEAAWKRALDHHDMAEDLTQVLTFVDGAENQPREDGGDTALKADVVEVQFLRMLAAYLDVKAWDRPDLIGRALTARRLAEAAIASPDLVTQYWIRNLVDSADGDRRLAEDNLYVGSPDALKQAESLWENVAAGEGEGGKYREALRRASALAKALAVRDRAWADGPYLAQCLLARLPAGTSDAANLRSLLDGTQKLSALLEDTPETDQWPAELPQATAQVEDALKKLSATYGDECYALRTAADDSHTLRRIAAVLALPLITGPERNALREKSLAIMTARQSTATTSAARTATADLGGDWRARLDQWEKTGEHPALTLLDMGAMDPGEKKLAVNWPDDLNLRLAAQGEKARARLDKVIGKAQQGVQETRVQLAKKGPARTAALRQGSCGAERALRASAAFFAGGPLQELQVDPIAELRRIDLRELLLWQSRRTMEDFWGPKPGAVQANDAAKPYFEIVAADDLRGADKLERSADVPEAGRLEQLTAAAESVVRPSVDPEKLLADDTIAEIPQRMTANVGAGLPRGEAAVFLEYSRGPLPATFRDNHLPVRRLPVDTQNVGPFRLPEYVIDKNWEAGKDWQARALYRGHIRTVDLHFVRLPPGASIVFMPQRTQLPAKISVYGGSQQQTGIFFILDCSGSMGEKVAVNNPAPKIDVARNALFTALDLLATNKEACRVGIIAYAHRLGWSQDNPPKIVTRNPNNPANFIPVNALVPPNPALLNLTPDNDIEVFDLPGGVIDQLSEKRVAEIRGRLGKLHHLGQTPLYHSIMDAIDQLNPDGKSQQKQIFVLTDGVDKLLYPDAKYTVDTLKNKLNANPGIRLDIVGFQINAGQLPADEKPEYDRMMALVKRLKDADRGEYFDANDRDGLLAALRKALNLDKYQVLHATTGEPASRPLELNKAFELNPLTPGRFRVQLVDSRHADAKDVYLDGGEALEMYLEKGRLAHHRYEREIRRFWDKIDDPTNHDHALWIGAHEPQRHGDDVEFHVSVQNGDEAEFSPRPVEAWLEVAPLAQPGAPSEAESYNFYDLSFLPDTPVPVLRVTAPNWRPQNEEAEISLWCKFRATEEERVPLGKLRDYRVTDVSDVRFDPPTVAVSASGDTKIVIREWHPKGADIHRLKVELLRPGDPRLVKVNRRFVSQPGDMGIVIHEFYLEGNPTAAEIDNFPVRLVSRKRLEQGAVSLPRPLRVTIPR